MTDPKREAVALKLREHFVEQYGWTASGDLKAEAYYGGNWLTFDFGKVAESLDAILALGSADDCESADKHIANGGPRARLCGCCGGLAISEQSREIDGGVTASPSLSGSADGEALNGSGWVYFNEDTGTEYASNHPIESGECSYATDVRRSTIMEDAMNERLQEYFQAALTPKPAEPANAGRVAIHKDDPLYKELNLRPSADPNPFTGDVLVQEIPLDYTEG